MLVDGRVRRGRKAVGWLRGTRLGVGGGTGKHAGTRAMDKCVVTPSIRSVSLSDDGYGLIRFDEQAYNRRL